MVRSRKSSTLLWQDHGYPRLLADLAFPFPASADARNNTTQSSLTYYERSLLRNPNAAKRIGGESFKPLDACNLCLSTVSDPVACQQGHLYCRECAISNLITQKAGIEVQKRELEAWQAGEELEKEEARRKARERVVSDFERGLGLGSSSSIPAAGGSSRPGLMSNGKLEEKVGAKAGERFTFNASAMESAASQAEEQALRKIEMEQAEARKAKLPAYWLPSLAPEARALPLKDVKLQTTCQQGKSGPHPLS